MRTLIPFPDDGDPRRVNLTDAARAMSIPVKTLRRWLAEDRPLIAPASPGHDDAEGGE